MTTIVTRAGKGSPLTNTEMDTNLTNLNSYKVEQDISGNATITGDVYLTGSGKRITGDFSNATVANRVMFQTSTTDGGTGVWSIPNGASASAQIGAFTGSDATNGSYLDLAPNGAESRIRSGLLGTGTYLPLTFYTGGSERMRIDASGNVLVTSPLGLGYGTGAGGTVTQATSKSTAVTLNRPTGQITMNNAALGAGVIVQFNVSNSLIAIGDLVLITFGSGTFTNFAYNVWANIQSVGGFTVSLRNIDSVSRSEAVVLNFAIIKGATT